jgi:biotin carboxyl carrier protein
MSTTNYAYRVTANDYVFNITPEEVETADMISNHSGEYNLIRNNQSWNAKIITTNNPKKLRVEVDGESFDIEIKDELDQMLEIMGFGIASAKVIKEIKAPMPGLVLDISVTEGQHVKEGERILILEAMKMENSIMVHTDATIKKIRVKPGQAVEKGQVLVDLD